MKTIGQIRRERLLQINAAGLSYAALNSLLGRNRRDATLSQLAKAAPNTTTGKPREMGGVQARQIEAALGLPNGWVDTDPQQDPTTAVIKLADGRSFTVISTAPKAPRQLVVKEPDAPPYGAPWPFGSIRPQDLAALSASSLATLERMIHAFLGHPTTPLDWRPTALRIAAELDREYSSDSFTTFVRAVEFELSRPAVVTAPAP